MDSPATIKPANSADAEANDSRRWDRLRRRLAVILVQLAVGATGLIVTAPSQAGTPSEHDSAVLEHCLASAGRTGEFEALHQTEASSTLAAPRLPVPQRVQDILARVLRVTRVPAKAITLVVVDGGSSAWISGSGELFVSTRLLDGRLEPEEIAGVLAHEIAHFENSDSRRKHCDMVAMAGDARLPHAAAKARVYRAIWAGDQDLAIRMFRDNHARELRADLRAADMLEAMGIPPKVMLLALIKSTPKGAGDYSGSHPALEVRLENLGSRR